MLFRSEMEREAMEQAAAMSGEVQKRKTTKVRNKRCNDDFLNKLNSHLKQSENIFYKLFVTFG